MHSRGKFSSEIRTGYRAERLFFCYFYFILFFLIRFVTNIRAATDYVLRYPMAKVREQFFFSNVVVWHFATPWLFVRKNPENILFSVKTKLPSVIKRNHIRKLVRSEFTLNLMKMEWTVTSSVGSPFRIFLRWSFHKNWWTCKSVGNEVEKKDAQCTGTGGNVRWSF